MSIADEIEGRTALSVLSKPIGRRSFIIGKFLGVIGPVAILFIVFDVEAIFFYPWAANFYDLSWFGFGAIAVFTVPLVVGLVFEWMKGGLEW